MGITGAYGVLNGSNAMAGRGSSLGTNGGEMAGKVASWDTEG